MRRVEVDHPNLLAALDWLERQGRYDLLLRLTGALSGFWLIYGHFRIGRDWLERALASVIHDRAIATTVIGTVMANLGVTV